MKLGFYTVAPFSSAFSYAGIPPELPVSLHLSWAAAMKRYWSSHDGIAVSQEGKKSFLKEDTEAAGELAASG